MELKLVIAEKPSVAQSLAEVPGADKRRDGYLEGNGYLVNWCIGHLMGLAEPQAYDEKYSGWRRTCRSCRRNGNTRYLYQQRSSSKSLRS